MVDITSENREIEALPADELNTLIYNGHNAFYMDISVL